MTPAQREIFLTLEIDVIGALSDLAMAAIIHKLEILTHPNPTLAKELLDQTRIAIDLNRSFFVTMRTTDVRYERAARAITRVTDVLYDLGTTAGSDRLESVLFSVARPAMKVYGAALTVAHFLAPAGDARLAAALTSRRGKG